MPRVLGTLASVFLASDGDKETDDFRQVPKSDDRERYSDRGMLGSYRTEESRFADPEDVRHFSGYGGGTDEDYRLGYVRPNLSEDPAYDLINYKDRYTQPSRVNEDFENTQSLNKDYEFRGRNRRSKGFLTRPHLPTER